MGQYDYDAVVVGSGPNGLAAAITLQQKGLSVLLLEAKQTIGGGMRTEALTLPGFKHDVCSAIHPMAVISPFFKTLSLEKFGLEYIYPEICAAHPLNNGTAAALYPSLTATAAGLDTDKDAYTRLISPVLTGWPLIEKEVLAPLSLPEKPLHMAAFGLKALSSALHLSKRFSTEKGKALWAGMTAHSLQPLSNFTTSAVGLVLMTAAHLQGWPLPKGGSQSLANALAVCFQSLGGVVQTGEYISSLRQLPAAKAVLFDVTPAQLLQIAGHSFSSLYRWQLTRYRYGMGVFKIDWALDDPAPFTASECRKAGTLHLGGALKEIAAAEAQVARGSHPERPFVLAAQQSLFDGSRAPAGKHTFWAYCHVPNGSQKNMTDAIEAQVERFAPGFRERIIGKHVMNTAAMEAYNNNYIGGDINGGLMDIRQIFTRPALRYSPFRTSAKGLYICSSATPPGGGVHGMCGYHAAQRVLKDLFQKHYMSNK
ncbi:MAG: NAD(P)/FAD-dependent oxidoreductase [Chitinophagaceae bacterium]|nr:NAD(P)/FAD-dependent oxidoreductase [Chitinophagaceae bacterium]